MQITGMTNGFPPWPSPSSVAAPVNSGTGGGGKDNQTYMQAARKRIRLWGQKVTDFDKKADTTGGHQQTNLDAAWARTKAGAAKFGTATADDWKRVEAWFDHASGNLEGALQRARIRLDQALPRY